MHTADAMCGHRLEYVAPIKAWGCIIPPEHAVIEIGLAYKIKPTSVSWHLDAYVSLATFNRRTTLVI
jgi:hypothetical protein